MRRRSIDLNAVKMLVLDEADQMLQMGFQEDVEFIISHLPDDRVTALFSATMPRPILDIVHRYMRTPEILRLSKPSELTVPEVQQVFYQVPFPRKFEALCRVLDVRQPDRAIVFCATKRMVDEAVERLQARGYVAEGLHGDMNQAGREKVLSGFRDGRTEILVATDVAARGLDVPAVSLVVNFDIPPDPEYYVHRIGRTGRLGRAGEAITFVNPREMGELRMIERATGARIRRADVPTAAEAEEREAQVLEERLLDVLAKDGWGPYRVIVQDLLDEYDPVDLAAAALAMAAARAPSRRASARDDLPVRDEPSTQHRASGYAGKKTGRAPSRRAGPRPTARRRSARRMEP
jgi:ATP-dependent RNA helicase DeaD